MYLCTFDVYDTLKVHDINELQMCKGCTFNSGKTHIRKDRLVILTKRS